MRIFVDSDTRRGCYLFEGEKPIITEYMGVVTVNVGEYLAVGIALREIIKRQIKEGEVFTDSLLVASQINGLWKCRAQHLVPLRDKARELLRQAEATITWLPREENPAGVILERREIATLPKKN